MNKTSERLHHRLVIELGAHGDNDVTRLCLTVALADGLRGAQWYRRHARPSSLRPDQLIGDLREHAGVHIDHHEARAAQPRLEEGGYLLGVKLEQVHETVWEVEL